jgi:hypothetical protein
LEPEAQVRTLVSWAAVFWTLVPEKLRLLAVDVSQRSRTGKHRFAAIELLLNTVEEAVEKEACSYIEGSPKSHQLAGNPSRLSTTPRLKMKKDPYGDAEDPLRTVLLV